MKSSTSVIRQATMMTGLLFLVLFVAVIDAQSQQNGVNVVQVEQLRFGSFIAATGGSLTVTHSGMRSPAGGVRLVSSDPGGAGSFLLSGPAGTSFTLLLSSASLQRTGGGGTMTIDSFGIEGSGSGVLPVSGEREVAFGATLHIEPTQQPGSYSGTFSVTVYFE